MPMSTTSATVNSRPLRMRSESVIPSMSSIAMYGTSPSTPTSKMVTMLGCDRTPAARASRRNRPRYCSSLARCGFSTFMASVRSISGS